VDTQLQLTNISYHISYHNRGKIYFIPVLNIHTPLFAHLKPVTFICPSSTE
jgi:hypothetical protein